MYTYENIDKVGNLDASCDTPLVLKNLKFKIKNRLVLGHLDINSLAGKFDQLKTFDW